MPTYESVVQSLSAYATNNLPTVLKALAILVVGWIVARVFAALIRAGLSRTDLDNRIADWVTGGKAAEEIPVERWVSRAIFYLLMLFVLVAFFQTLGLSAITVPLNTFLNQVFGYLPRLLGPAILAALAFVLATALRWAVRAALQAADLDKRFADQTAGDVEKPLPLSHTLSEAVYWLIFLLFLPAILGPLGLDGLLEPVQNVVDQLLGFLPQVLAAIVILAVGWFVARILQRIVGSLLAAVGVDRVSEQFGLEAALGKQRLSSLLGTVVYVLILVPVLIAALEALAIESVTRPASEMLNTVLRSIPHIFAAALVLTIAFFVGRIVGGLATNLLAASGFNSLPSRLGLTKAGAQPKHSPAELAGRVVIIVVMLFAATEAARLLGFEAIGELVTQFTVFGGQVILGLIILGVGLFLADVAGSAIQASSARESALLALAARVAIVVLTGAMALRRMGLANEIISLAFGLTLGAIAIAVALAFGLGARETAGRQVDQWMSKLRGKGRGDSPDRQT